MTLAILLFEQVILCLRPLFCPRLLKTHSKSSLFADLLGDEARSMLMHLTTEVRDAIIVYFHGWGQAMDVTEQDEASHKRQGTFRPNCCVRQRCSHTVQAWLQPSVHTMS